MTYRVVFGAQAAITGKLSAIERDSAQVSDFWRGRVEQDSVGSWLLHGQFSSGTDRLSVMVEG